jgi:hypothetical protein
MIKPFAPYAAKKESRGMYWDVKKQSLSGKILDMYSDADAAIHIRRTAIIKING